MRHPAKLLSLATLTALLANSPAIARTGAVATEPATHSLSINLVQTQPSQRQAEAHQIYQRGMEQFNIGQYQAAIESWQAAAEIYQNIGDISMEGAALWQIASVQLVLGNPFQAIELYDWAVGSSVSG